jgi:hypothetical protein
MRVPYRFFKRRNEKERGAYHRTTFVSDFCATFNSQFDRELQTIFSHNTQLVNLLTGASSLLLFFSITLLYFLIVSYHRIEYNECLQATSCGEQEESF